MHRVGIRDSGFFSPEIALNKAVFVYTMFTLIKKLNKIIAAIILLSVLSVVPANSANAGFRDWITNSENRASTSQNFSFLNSFLGITAQLDGDSRPGDAGLTMFQNSTLVSVDSPASAKTGVTAKNAATKTREMIVSATAYSSTPDQTDDSPFVTAWNTRVRDGIVAANFLPFGTRIKIPEIYGDKIFVVEDRMNRRYWHKVDIWFPDRQSALEFGLRTIKIQILES
mgnify:FL=1